MKKVYIIILNWNGLDNTIECLESLKKVVYPNFRVLVIDNGSEKDEGKILKEKFGNFIEVIRNDKNLGFAGGNNLGIKYALEHGAEMVLLLNSDTTVNPDFLDKMVEKMKDATGMVACKILSYFKHAEINAVWSQVFKNGLFIGKGFGEKDEGQCDGSKFVFGPSGCCALYSRKMLEDIKSIEGDYFDNDLYLYHEDIDLDFRAQWRGWKCKFVPEAVIYHKHSQSLEKNKKKSPVKNYYTSRNTLLVDIKNYPGKFFWLIIPMQIMIFFYNLLHWKKSALRGQVDALKSLFKFLEKRKNIQNNVKVPASYINKLFKCDE